MPFVLDSSVALAWLLPDEGSEAIEPLADRLERDTVRVPNIQAIKVGNALLAAQRRDRIKNYELARMIAALDRRSRSIRQRRRRAYSRSSSS